MSIPRTTHRKLSNLKKEGETYNDVVRKLVDLDHKYNFKKTIEYEVMTNTAIKVFRITFKNEDYHIEYYNPKIEFSKKAKAWDYFPHLSDEEEKAILEFLANPTNINRLKNMQYSESFGIFEISRIG